MIEIKIKPLSVNECFQGRRFKTPKYKSYEIEALLKLPKLVIPQGKLKVVYEFGLSNVLADYDNIIKPFQDILQKKYGFSDANIWEAEIRKIKVDKGNEFIRFEITEI